MIGQVYFGDNLQLLKKLPDKSVHLIYIDPPFNTGKKQALKRMKAVATSDESGRIGFQGKRYTSVKIGELSYDDDFADYLGFLRERLVEAYRVLRDDGSLYFHIDYREVHYCKILLDDIFGRNCFLNEIIWAYDYGARTKRRWPAKHDNILYYVKNPHDYVFNYEDLDRIPYMAPGMVGAEKATRGKTPTDTWWHTIVPTNSKERTGYPTQKPLAILKRIITASSRPGDVVLDFFAGSGTTGEACLQLGRRFILADCNPSAIEIMKKRFANREVVFFDLEPANG